LLSGREAVFFAFDWESGAPSIAETRVAPNSLILLEGVYSASPELADLVDRAVYVSTPEAERLRRLRRRISPEEWDCEWLRAEMAYFAEVRPPGSFDLVVPGTGGAALQPAPVSVLAKAGLRADIDPQDTDRP
jgi:para-aminobenzoate synthetase